MYAKQLERLWHPEDKRAETEVKGHGNQAELVIRVSEINADFLVAQVLVASARESRTTLQSGTSSAKTFLWRNFLKMLFVKSPTSKRRMVRGMLTVAMFPSEKTIMGTHLTELEMLGSLFSVRSTWHRPELFHWALACPEGAPSTGAWW